MFLLVNLFATFGALVLTIMGVAISLSFPIGGQRGHFVWMIAFVVVGIPATVATYFVVHLNGQATETAQTVPAVRRVEPNAFAVRPAPQARVERVRVTYGEHRNRPYGNRPQAVTYEVRQTVQPAVSPTIFAPPRTSTVIPSNTFSCAGFTKDPDGSWEAGSDTQPFNVGSAENIVIRNQGPIEPGWVTVGGVDLYELIDKKCGAQSAH
jgi:hypothetical protein